MKLFNGLEAFKFPQENLILITRDEYLYYIYEPQYKRWYIHKNAGNDMLTVRNYPDISKKELADALGGKFPEKETDILRFCSADELHVMQMISLLEEDYPKYLEDKEIWQAARRLLTESDICYKSYESLQKLFADARALRQEPDDVLSRIKELSLAITGRDIFRYEIEIIDGHDPSSYFWIRPVRVIDYSNTDAIDSVAEMTSAEISIEEDDVAQYLKPFLDKHFDDSLKANRNRFECYGTDDDGNEIRKQKSGFEWYLTHNFYTHEAVKKILDDLNDTILDLTTGRESEYTKELRIKRGTAANLLIYAKGLTAEQIDEYNANRPKEDDTHADLIIDFYRRFIYRMEYMMKVGKEKGYDLISFMGP